MKFKPELSTAVLERQDVYKRQVMRRGFIAGRLQSYCVRFSNFGNTAANPAQPASSFS